MATVDYKKIFMKLWYDVDDGWRITSSSAWSHAKAFRNSLSDKELKDITWDDIRGFALEGRSWIVMAELLCFMIESHVGFGREFEEFKGMYEDLRRMCDAKSDAVAHIFEVDGPDDLMIEYDADSSRPVWHVVPLVCRDVCYRELLKKAFSHHSALGNLKVMDELAKSLNGYVHPIESIDEFNGDVFLFQVEYGREHSESQGMYMRYLLVFWRYLIHAYPGYSFFSEGDAVSESFVLSNSAKTYLEKGYSFAALGDQLELVSHPRMILRVIGLNSISTRKKADDYIALDFHGYEECGFLHFVEIFLENASVADVLNSVDTGGLMTILKAYFYLENVRDLKFDSEGVLEVSRSDALLLRNYIEMEPDVKRSTVQQRLNRIKSMLLQLAHLGYAVLEDNVEDMFFQEGGDSYAPPKTIPDSDLSAIFIALRNAAAADDKMFAVYVIVNILLETHMRISSVVSLNVDAVHESLKPGRYEIESISKTSHGKAEINIISASIWRLMQEYDGRVAALRKRAPMSMRSMFFVYGDASSCKVMTAATFTHTLERISLELGLPVYSAQNFRDTHMNKADEYNARIKGNDLMLSQLTGHRNIETTEKHYMADSLRKYLEAMYKVDFDAVSPYFAGRDIRDNVVDELPSSVDRDGDVVMDGCGWCTSSVCDSSGVMECLVCRHFVSTCDEAEFFRREIRRLDEMNSRVDVPIHEKETRNLKKTVLAMYLEKMYEMGASR